MKSYYELQRSYQISYEVAKELLAKDEIFLDIEGIYNYLIKSPEIDEYENLIIKQIPAKKIAKIVKCEYELSPPPVVIEEVELSESIIPKGISVLVTHQKVKVKGEIWVIHKNDVDPFPSNPHAHNYQNNFVVHLGNGVIYRKRKKVGQLKMKKLILLRNKIKCTELPKFIG